MISLSREGSTPPRKRNFCSKSREEMLDGAVRGVVTTESMLLPAKVELAFRDAGDSHEEDEECTDEGDSGVGLWDRVPQRRGASP
jgi:hypothetical protein